jgi:hypothetical protein
MLYVTGGKQRTRKLEEWHRFEKAVLAAVDPESGKSSACLEYLSPPEACTDVDPSMLFKAASVEGDQLCLCTSTEILLYDARNFRQTGYISLPCFNDLHHAWPQPGGNLLVVNTGLDMLLEITGDGQVVREWSVIGEELWTRFNRAIDYRKIAATKPHSSHPNYVFTIDGEIWVTRFNQKDAISIERPERRIEFGRTPHDGQARNGKLYFTSIDGYAFVVDQKTLAVEETINLNQLDESDVPLGWCRGILPVEDGKCWVGFTKIRPTTLKENLVWLGKKLSHETLRTSRIVLYDFARKAKLKEINLEPAGINAVFSIFELPGMAARPGKQ